MANGMFLEVWKKARVMPVLKSGAADQVGNYWPISTLSVFSKVLEKVVAMQLMNYLEMNNYLQSIQFRFRSKLSTECKLPRVGGSHSVGCSLQPHC